MGEDEHSWTDNKQPLQTQPVNNRYNIAINFTTHLHKHFYNLQIRTHDWTVGTCHTILCSKCCIKTANNCQRLLFNILTVYFVLYVILCQMPGKLISVLLLLVCKSLCSKYLLTWESYSRQTSLVKALTKNKKASHAGYNGCLMWGFPVSMGKRPNCT